MAWLKSIFGLDSALRAPNKLAQSAAQLGKSTSPLFEIRSSPGKGLGVFATKNIPRDAIIMRDPVVFRYEEGEGLVERYRRFTMLPGTTQEDVLKLAVQQDPKKCFAVGLAVAASTGGKGLDGILINLIKHKDIIPRIMHLEDVIATNGFGLHADAESPGGLFLNASRINHSCVGNADQASHDDIDYKVMRANRDIEPGEEITTSYIANFLFREDRRLALKRRNFACDCPACDSGNPFSHAHERRLKAINQLCEDFCMDGAGRLNNAGKWSYAVLEKAADRASKRIELFNGNHAIRRFSLQARLGALDIALAKYKLRRIRSDLENALKLLESIIEADKIYYGETSTITRAHEELYDELHKGAISGV